MYLNVNVLNSERASQVYKHSFKDGASMQELWHLSFSQVSPSIHIQTFKTMRVVAKRNDWPRLLRVAICIDVDNLHSTCLIVRQTL